MNLEQSCLKGIYAITLFEEDLFAAKQFYENIFGLKVVFEDTTSCVYKMGETLINLLDIKAADELIAPALVAEKKTGFRQVFTITVDDVDAVCAELDSKDVKLINGPVDRPWGIRTASFEDPGGHIWEIAK